VPSSGAPSDWASPPCSHDSTLPTYLYVGAIVLLVGIQLDELLRKDVEDNEDRGILELVRGVL
jgi:hypothetical protein